MNFTEKDKKVIKLFIDKKAGVSSKLESDGVTLDGLWIGGGNLAKWQNDKIVLGANVSRSTQAVQNFIRRNTPKSFLKENKITESVLGPYGAIS